MKYNIFTSEQVALLTPAEEVDATMTALMSPVECIDCKQYVPFGWIEFGSVRCPEGGGSGGVQYGHRIPTEVYTNVKDTIVNEQIKAREYLAPRPDRGD